MEPPRNSTAPETATRSAAANGRATADESPPVDAFQNAVGQFAELREYLNFWITSKVDSLKLTARTIALYAVLGIFGAVMGIGALVTAVVLLLSGLAGAIGAMFNPDRPWAGELILGFVVVAGTFVAASVAVKSILAASRKRTIEKYEKRKRDDRGTFGRDVQERAREQAR